MSRYKTIVALLAITAVIMTVAEWVISSSYKKEELHRVEQKLTSSLEAAHQAVKSWVSEELAFVEVWGHIEHIQPFTEELLQTGKSQKALTSSAAQGQLRQWFKNITEIYKYEGFFLVDKNLINLASSRDQNLGKKNLLRDQSRFFNRIWAGRSALSFPLISDVPLVDDSGTLQSGRATMFTGAPIYNRKGNIIAALLIRINPYEEFFPILKKAWFGKTGEVFAFDRQAQLVSKGRFVDQIRQDAETAANTNNLLGVQLRDPGVNLVANDAAVMPSAQRPLTEMASLAIRGEDGVNMQGYRGAHGFEVLGAWLWDNELDLGIAAEVAKKEVYEHIVHKQWLVRLSVILALIVLLGAIFYMRSQKRLMQVENSLRDIIDLVPNLIFVRNNKGVVEIANNAFAACFGYASSKQVEGEYSGTICKDRYYLTESIELDQQVISSGQACTVEENLVDSEGNERLFTTTRIPYRKRGEKYEAILAVSVDTTQQKRYERQIEELNSDLEKRVEERTRLLGQEVEERIQAIIKLEEAQEHMRLLLNSTAEGIYGLDAAGKTTFVNPAAADMLGYEIHELIGKPMHDLIHHSYPDGSRYAREHCPMNAAFTDGKVHKVNNEVLWRRDGSSFPVEYTSTPIRKEGELVGAVVIFQDISERKQIEESLEQQRVLFQSVFRDVPDAMVLADSNRRIMMINPSLSRLFDYDLNEVLGLKTSVLYESEADFERQGKQRFNSVAERGPEPYVVRYRKKNNEIFSGETVGTAIKTESGELLGFIGVIRDITQRLRAEQELLDSRQTQRAALDAAHAGIFSMNLATEEVIWDTRSCVILGLPFEDSAEEKRGGFDEWSNCMHPQDLESTVTELQNSLQDKTSGGFELFYRVLHKDGTTLYLHTLGTVERDVSGEAVFAKGINFDITEQHESEKEREQLQQQLQQAQKMESIGQLTGGIAHDFNNILASVKGFNELAQQYCETTLHDEKLTRYLQHVETASGRAAALVRQMLTFSRGSQQETEPLSLTPLVNEAVNMLRPMLPSTIGINIQSAEEALQLEGNPVQINQMLVNLCINARDAMHEKGQITIGSNSLRHQQGVCASCFQDFTGDFVELFVRDSGEGIPPGLIERIFNPFTTTKEVGKGSGMGLAMVHGIMHEYGGHILVESKPRHGTTFRLLFPTNEVVSGDMDEKPIVTDKTSISSADKSNKVMVVDDEVGITHLLTELLSQHGYVVTAFNDSKKALEVFLSDPSAFDIVVTDQTMPELTGAELAKQMLQVRPDLVVVICTGYSKHVDEDMVRKMGVAALIDKPIEVKKLLSAIKEPPLKVA